MGQRKTSGRQKTAGEVVYEYMCNSIIEMRLKPGQLVSIKDLSEHLNVSRSPVRDALIRLENEGLITSMPQRGTLISKIDTERSNNERFLRICVEEKIVGMFADVANDDDIQHLEQNVIQQRKAEKDMNVREFLKLDDEFHGYFYKRTGKEFCFNLVQSNVGHYNRIRLLSCMEENMLDNSIAQHEIIIQLIREKKKGELEENIINHLMKIEQDEIELKHKHPDLFEGMVEPAERADNIWQADYLGSIASGR